MIWLVLTSNNFTFSGTQFGLDTDVTAPGDYDGDGRFDLAVYRGSGASRDGPATFFVQRSRDGFQAVQFGLGSDLVVPGDYDGDGRTDISVWNPQNGIFSTLRSSDNATVSIQFGQNGDYPIANYNTF